MTGNSKSVPLPVRFLETAPLWADPTEVEPPLNREVRAYLTDCFFLLPHRLVYCPEERCIVGVRGYMNLPDSYAEYPMLGIYFAKYRLRKYPYDILRNDITWPEPYVVLNTIMRRLRTHRFLKGHADAASIPEEIRKAIAPNLQVPNGREHELLEVPYSERKLDASRVVQVFEGHDVRQEVEDFFHGLLDSRHWELYPDSSVLRVVSDYPLRSQEEVSLFTIYLRKLWYIEKILVLMNMVPDSPRPS